MPIGPDLPKLAPLDYEAPMCKYEESCTKLKVSMRSFTTADAVSLTGTKKDMLNYLCKMQVVVPTVSRRQGKRGHRKERRYSFTDLAVFKFVKQLAASGVQRLLVGKAIREMRAFGVSLHKLPASHVVMVGQSVYLWNSKGDPFRVVNG